MEMSQRSLESMLQNKVQADEIFNKTVQLAVKSPFRIKDLVNYTKQLAAYRIENDKLYDTTKRLADVSAGLGVDMSRLILAYGQVKAAAYLRALRFANSRRPASICTESCRLSSRNETTQIIRRHKSSI